MLTRQAQEIFGDEWGDVRNEITAVDVTPVDKWLVSTDSAVSLTEDVARIAPPWPNCWFEYVPQGSLGKSVIRAGVHITSQFGEANPPIPFGSGLDLDPDDIEGSFMETLYLEGRNGEVLKTHTTIVFLDEDGFAATSQLLTKTHDGAEELAGLGDRPSSEIAKFLHMFMDPIHFGLSLCHASNVEIGEDPVPPAVQKKRRKAGKNPGKTFKTLEIEPMIEQARYESSNGESELERAQHICRGHFKTYTEENPLFGEHTGTYWWGQHLRGTKDAGEVEKDYRVNEPIN